MLTARTTPLYYAYGKFWSSISLAGDPRSKAHSEVEGVFLNSETEREPCVLA